MVDAEDTLYLLGFLVLLSWLGGGGALLTSNLSLVSVALFLGWTGRPRLNKSVMRQLLLALDYSCVFGGFFGGSIVLV